MLLPLNKVSEVAQEMVASLLEGGDIETSSPREVQLDLEAVLNQYLRTEQELHQKARDSLSSRGLAPTEYSRVLKALAEQKKIKVGDDAIDYVLEQLLEMLMNSSAVDEIFAQDHELRKKLRAPLRKRASTNEDLDRAVRDQLKHIKEPEGSSLWEIEYRRMMEEIKRRKGL
jgi:uncharacterized protein